jgi:hypothetical protein
MKVKPEKPNRNFVPVSIADSLRIINKKFLYKYGKLDFTIHSKWAEIVGKFFVNHSEPQKITSVTNSVNESGETIYDRYLHVNVSPAAALEFQHFQDKIIEKINSYFGYKAIKGIKIYQHYQQKNNTQKVKKNLNLITQEKNKSAIQKSTPNLSNKNLQESIVNLGLSITNEE